MYFEKYKEDMKACRFCFMCRHLSAVGNVLFSEADTPRGRALMLDTASMNKDFLFKKDVIDTMYRSDLSACCRYHCVTHFDENNLVLAARRDIVEAGKAPEKVVLLAKKLQKENKFSLEGEKADIVYFAGEKSLQNERIFSAFACIMKEAKVKFSTLSGEFSGKKLKVLGYEKEAEKSAKIFAEAIKKSGAKVFVVSDPAIYDAVKNDFPAWGIKLKAEVLHTSQYFAKLLKAKKLKAKKSKLVVSYLDSDFLKNYNDETAASREVLNAFGFILKDFGTNNEESYSAGEGACVLQELDSSLVTKLAQKVRSRADEPEKDLLVVSSPYTARVLKEEGNLNTATLEEVIAAQF